MGGTGGSCGTGGSVALNHQAGAAGWMAPAPEHRAPPGAGFAELTQGEHSWDWADPAGVWSRAGMNLALGPVGC